MNFTINFNWVNTMLDLGIITVTSLGYLFCFKAAEEALHWAVTQEVTSADQRF